MYHRLSEYEEKLIKEVEKKTGIDYGVLGEFISCDIYMCIIEDLMGEIGILEEKIEDLEEYREQYCNLCDDLEKDL